jgi:hypothetical protein
VATSYVTPSMLSNAPTGVPWSLIPEPRAPEAAQLAEQTNICWRATSIVDTYVNQVLRATVDNEYLTGPGAPRVGVEQGTCVGKLVMRRWPVIDVLAIQTSPNRSFPRVWSTVPSGQYEPTFPLINSLTDTAAATAPDGGSSITVAPGYIPPLRCGRNSTRILVSYTNGWPHTSLTASAIAGATTLAVDDVTGWAGASGFVYDGASTEPTSASAVSATTPLPLPNGAGTAQTGPGTITLSSPLAYPHAAGTVVSALPANVLWATVLAAAAQALEAGMDSIAIQTMPGVATSSGGGVEDLQTQYEVLLDPFRRVM